MPFIGRVYGRRSDQALGPRALIFRQAARHSRQGTPWDLKWKFIRARETLFMIPAVVASFFLTCTVFLGLGVCTSEH